MSLETEASVTPPHAEIVCACPPSHRRLRVVLSVIVGILFVALVGCLVYLRLTGGLGS